MVVTCREGIIKANPIGDGLDAWNVLFESICTVRRIRSSYARRKEFKHYYSYIQSNSLTDTENLTLDLLFALRNLPTSRILPSPTNRGTLQQDLRKLISAAASETFDFLRISPLLNTVLARKSDSDIWNCVYDAIVEPTPPPRTILHKTSSFANSSEYRQDINRVLKSELRSLYIRISDFRSIYFRGINNLIEASNAVFKRCTEEYNKEVSKKDKVVTGPAKSISLISICAALLTILEGCITGYKSLRNVGILYCNILVNNLLINKDKENPLWLSFLINLDLAIREERNGVTGANRKTSMRAFMAIGLLLGEKHSFMHDLELFFWVIFWICIYYKGPNKERTIPRFDKWNFVDTEELADSKKGAISDE
ncbi:hypothetical protein N7456_003541 [Penicillium angulare]|uniref:Fungal-type protein kinase domain-containing protein n=1 Tax=Penicillium angulare TaxID=116970 RepID=A0A9W9FUV3_9EURO|nr:hypothetical protein N7456_003541 [Penicillium angulare]